MTRSQLSNKQVCKSVRDCTDTANNFYTPAYAIEPIVNILPPATVIWECASGEGDMEDAFRECGYTVHGTDIHSGQDFRNFMPGFEFDCIITNPPFVPSSIKQEFLERLKFWWIEHKKPSALLMPLTALEGETRQKIYKELGLHLIVMNSRINFITPTKKQNTAAWFATAWFTFGLLEPGISYADIRTAKRRIEK